MTLEGKTAIVTGGAGGIGQAIAERFLREGAAVMMVDIDSARGSEAEQRLGKLGKARFFKADVSERLDVHNMLAAALEHFGDLDILVNNAGVVHKADFLDLKEEDFERVLRINLKGPFLASQGVGRYMVEKVGNGGSPGSIINLSSVQAVLAMADQVAYGASKGAIDMLTKAMALSLAPYGIRVNAVGPGSIMTDMLSATMGTEGGRDMLLSRTPLGRIGEPSEIASIAAFLASDDASYITGQTIYADGGRLALNYTAAPQAPALNGS
ncbi:SDR family oxidoreductase [Escherichia coli]|nr:SDR family oxidoreductase [Escherichia coli]MIL10023.1 SDR family oxidoreductase [Salmonella enterica subsp. enterica serovar Enteritidis]